MEDSNKQKLQQIKAWLGSGSINIFGMPYAGKDTHGKELATLFGGELIGGGDIIRNSDSDSLKKLISGGDLAPTDQYMAMVMPYLSKQEFENKPLILSSVGRWYGEHTGLIRTCTEAAHPLKAVVLLDISPEEVLTRWHAAQDLMDRGDRDDDDHHKLDKRLEEFRTKTTPVIDYYRQEGLLLDIDGRPPKQQVLQEIIDQLHQLAT